MSDEKHAEAQAAVIARVQSVIDDPDIEDVCLRKELRRALAAAPEHTGPVNIYAPDAETVADPFKVLTEPDIAERNAPKLRTQLAAANARVAELESRHGWVMVVRERDAANARADAAEGKLHMMLTRAEAVDAARARAESELAELKVKYEAAERRALDEHKAGCDGIDNVCDVLSRAESEAAVLRAEVERLRSMVPHPGDGTCERCGTAPAVKVALCHEHRIFLATAPAPTEREKAERQP